jgi:hypothetical protein
MEASRDGMRALWSSLGVLGATAVLQAVVTAFSGSVALLGDTLHNVADALTAVPLGIAFMLGRRVATRRYTHGYGRAEDLAGVVIVLFIAASSALAGYEAVLRLLHPSDVDHLPYVAAAALTRPPAGTDRDASAIPASARRWPDAGEHARRPRASAPAGRPPRPLGERTGGDGRQQREQTVNDRSRTVKDRSVRHP